MHKFLRPFLILFISLPGLCAAADPVVRDNFDHLLPSLKEAYPGLVSASVVEMLPVGDAHYVVLFRCRIRIPQGLSRAELDVLHKTQRESEMLLLILDRTTLEVALPLGKFPFAGGFPHRRLLYYADAGCVAFWDLSDDYKTEGDLSYIYFSLEEKKVLEIERSPRVGVHWLVEAGRNLVAANYDLEPVVEVEIGKWIELPEEVKTYSSPSARMDNVAENSGRGPIPLKKDPASSLRVADAEIEVLREGELTKYALPQPTPLEFVRLRIDPYWLDVRHPESGRLENTIGPFIYREGRLLFGLNFYNSEGVSGIGGLGEFNPETGAFVIEHHPALTDFSVTALHETVDGTLWMGIGNSGEGGVYGNGLLRYEPEKKLFTHYAIEGSISSIKQSGDIFYFATPIGLMLFRDERLCVIKLHPRLDGGFAVEFEKDHVPGKEVMGPIRERSSWY